MTTFRQLCATHFDPLVAALALTPGAVKDHEMYGLVEAAAGNVAIRFEHDRGLCEFSISSTAAPERAWSLLLVAALFPRVRVLAAGEQRLSLDEQAQIIQAHWLELQELLSPARLPSTVERLQAENDRRLVAAGMKTANKTMEPTR